MLGESPIIVAEPCRFELTAIPIKNGTGFAFSFLATSNAIGATIRTVATFSVKLEIKLAKMHMYKSAIPTFFDLPTRCTAKNPGTSEYIKSPDNIIVPRNTPITLKFMLKNASLTPSAPENKITPTPANTEIKGWILRLNKTITR